MTFTLCSGTTQLYRNDSQPRLLFWATKAGHPPQGVSQVWASKQLGYFLFIEQPPGDKTFYSGLEDLMKDKNPAQPSFGWVPMSKDKAQAPILLELNADGVIETSLTLGFNTDEAVDPTALGGAFSPNLTLPNNWSVKIIQEVTEVGFQFLYPTAPPNNPPDAYPPHPTNGNTLYLSVDTDAKTNRCGRFFWNGVRYDSSDDVFLEFDFQFDPLSRAESYGTFNGLIFKLVPTGTTPDYKIELVST